MKQLYLTALLLSSCNGILAMQKTTVQFPSAQEINRRFINAGMRVFVQESRLDKILGGKKKTFSEFSTVLDIALDNLNKKDNYSLSDSMIAARKKHMLGILLEDQPTIMKDLKQKGHI